MSKYTLKELIENTNSKINTLNKQIANLENNRAFLIETSNRLLFQRSYLLSRVVSILGDDINLINKEHLLTACGDGAFDIAVTYNLDSARITYSYIDITFESKKSITLNKENLPFIIKQFNLDYPKEKTV
jgi:hypothetical protein